MTKDDFIKQQDIAYLDRKHKKRVGIYTKIRSFPFVHGHLIIQMMCLIFKMKVRIMGLCPIHNMDTKPISIASLGFIM
jgi:hypothetical protein